MRVFAISDLHLPGGRDKTMDIFGQNWAGHFDKIAADWLQKVTAEDTVLIPGDLSWAMTFDEARDDLKSVCALPGIKVFGKGNHDFWWSSISRLRSILPDGAFALQYDAVKIGDLAIAGTRGWDFSDGSSGVLRRELMRLEMALKRAASLDCAQIIAMTHYPPFDEKGKETDFTRLMADYGVKYAVYGHMHGASYRHAVTGNVGGVEYHLVSCDALGFKLLRIL